MDIAESRWKTIYSRVRDAKQLVRSMNQSAWTIEQVKRDVFVRLASAHFSFSLYRLAMRSKSKSIQLAGGKVKAEELFDQAKAILELCIPILLLHYVPPDRRGRLAAEVVEQLRHDELTGEGLSPLFNAARSDVASHRTFDNGVFLDFAAWFEAVVAATIKADEESWLAGVASKWFRSLS